MKILIVDDSEVIRRQLYWALRRGNDLYEAAHRDEVRTLISNVEPDVVLMEFFEEGDSDENIGLSFVEELLKDPGSPFILIITRSPRKDIAAKLIQMGVLDVLPKPVAVDELPVILKQAERLKELSASLGSSFESTPIHSRRPQTENKTDTGIIGVDPLIKGMLEQITRIAPTPVSVLITGETGTGKERFAQAVHMLSDRKDRSFVPLNCAVLSENLVEDELFGHEKGAFTGAVDRRKGRFETAHRGTLFLDEIGDLSPGLQAKFLRVLQEKRFERLGGNQLLDTDFRLVSATHRTLSAMVKEGIFREDLMFRINVVSFHIPPLRDRRGDIRLLADTFLSEYTKSFGRTQPMHFTPEVVRFLMDYHWPGNVRELKHFIERAVALTEGSALGPEILPVAMESTTAGETLAQSGGKFEGLIKHYKRQLVMEALEMAGKNKVQTAQILGISKSYLFKLIKQLSIPK